MGCLAVLVVECGQQSPEEVELVWLHLDANLFEGR
jgi:hypothetical protein